MREGYDSYLMSDFNKILNAKFQNDKNYEFDILYGSFFNEDNLTNADERTWNLFRRICQQLTQLESYAIIINFMYGVFLNYKKYNIDRMKEILEKISVTAEINLWNLCTVFFIYTKTLEESYDFSEEKKQEILEMALVQSDNFSLEYISEQFGSNGGYSYSPSTMIEILPEYICSRVYDYSINMEKFGVDELKVLIEKVLDKRRIHLEETIKKIQEQNDEIENKNHMFKLHISKIVTDNPTYFDYNCVVPGCILPIFKAAELKNKENLCYDILNSYVLKVFSETPWECEGKKELPIMVALLASYGDFIFSLTMQRMGFNLTAPTITYNNEKFLMEMIGKTDGMFISKGKNLYKEYSEMGMWFKLIIARGKDYIKSILPRYIYSFLIVHTTFMLYCTQQKELAIKHLLDNYDDIDVSDKRKLYFQVTLARCILSCEHLETANILYGHFNYEMDRQNREKLDIFVYINSMLQFLDEAKEYIRLKEDYTIQTKESWYDILYKDGKIDALVEKIRRNNDAYILVEEPVFKQLMKIIEAYSYQAGIHLTLLGLPKYDNYDKLQGALSYGLQMRARGYIEKLEEYNAFFQSVNQSSIRHDLDLFFQHHLSKLTRNTIEDSLEKISNLKKRYSDTEAENGKALEALLDDICEELSMKLQYYGSGRADIERTIYKAQNEFMKKYCPDYVESDNVDFTLIQKLPLNNGIRTKVLNYLITSETVYRMLSARNDAEELDFSAALISLTKVVEVILNFIFSKMDVQNDPSLDNKVRKSYFFNGSRKDHIEFGPGIYLFRDARKIVVKHEPQNALSLDNVDVYAFKHFQEWKGNDVIDVSKLRRYTDVDICVTDDQSNDIIMHFKANEDDHNRKLLVKGLEFIKDNYRNAGAHTETVELAKFEKGRELLLLTENMIWILLDILII